MMAGWVSRPAIVVLLLVGRAAEGLMSGTQLRRPRAACERRGVVARMTTTVEEGDAVSEDLSGDGGVVKVWSRGGSSRRELADDGSIVRMRYKAFGDAGLLLAQSDDLIYTVGDASWIPGLDIAVRSMSVGETATFACAPAYAYGEDGVPPAIRPGEDISIEIFVSDYRGNVDASTFAQDKPLTPRTASEIKAEYERRRAARLAAAEASAADEQDDDLLAPFKKALATFQSYYFFGFFESQTGEAPPWYLRPFITFPLIFLVTFLSFSFLVSNDVILLKGSSPTIPGETNFSL